MTNEAELKKHLKSGAWLPVYFFFGEETYLSSHYAARIAETVAGKDDFAQFNLHKFEGDAPFEQIEDAVEALPLMAEKSCVVVRDLDVTAADVNSRLTALLKNPPADAVLVIWLDTLQPDLKKSAKWRNFEKAVAAVGMSVEFPRKTVSDTVVLLGAFAAKRGCLLRAETARLMIEQCGNDLHTLLSETEKLCALTDGGEITPQHVRAAAIRHLESSVYDLSKATLSGQYATAYTVLHRLWAAQENPVSVLAVLAGAYVDAYRVKIAAAAGQSSTELAHMFNYRGREFRLRYAARDAARLSVPVLRHCIEVLAQADTELKTARADKQLILEKTVAKLIVATR